MPYQLHCSEVLVQVPSDELVDDAELMDDVELRIEELERELLDKGPESTTVKNEVVFVAELPALSVTVSVTVLVLGDAVIEKIDSVPVAFVTGSLPK